MANIVIPSTYADDDILEISAGHRMIRKNGAWRLHNGNVAESAAPAAPVVVGFDRYDLKHITTTGELDLEIGQTFVLDNTDSEFKTISIINRPPHDRSMTIVLEIDGDAGFVEFPGSVVWSNGAPVLAANKTVVILYFNGSQFVGAQGPSY